MSELREWLDEQIAIADGRGARDYAERSEVLREVRERLTVTPVPEVVSGAEAAAREIVAGTRHPDLPAGSIAVQIDARDCVMPAGDVYQAGVGWLSGPGADAYCDEPATTTSDTPATYRLLVLHRALADDPPPPPPLAVGDVVETAAGLERLPAAAIVEDRCHNVASRLDPEVANDEACWGITGLDGPAHGYELYFPAVMRYLPGAAS